MRKGLAGLVLLPLLVACGGRYRAGTVDAAGYRHPEVEYRIAAREGGGLLDENWVLDNFRDERFLRETPAYVTRRRYDVDGDGDLEDLGARALDDLRFRSRQDAGAIWVRTVPLPASLTATDMRVLMQLIVDGLAYTGTVAAAVDRGVVAGASRAYAATIIASEPLAVDGREAYAATIDVANVAQLQLDPDARSERLRIVLVRTDFRVPLDPRDFQLGLAPGLLMLGYANLPGEFDRWSDHFDDLVRRLVFDTPEASAGAELMACESPDGITAFAFLRLGVTRAPLVIVRAEDQEDRECIERALATSRLEESRSYGFRPASLRFSVPPPTPVPDGPSALADAPAPQ